MLIRIVALLLALADLAELAGRKSLAFRAMLLLILRPAEAATRRYVMEVCGYAHDTPLPYLGDDDDSAAMRLALSFRVLAAMLTGLPEWAFDEWAHEGCGGINAQLVLRELLGAHELLRHMLARPAPELRDTS